MRPTPRTWTARPGVRLATVLIALALPLAVACAPTKSAAPNDIYGRVNEIRAQHGVGPLAPCAPLAAAAQAHASDMAANGLTGHIGSDGSTPAERLDRHGYHWSRLGEITVRGQPTVDAALAAWMGSARHSAILLRGVFQHVGFGYADGGVWVADFGAGGTC